jgi:hypothetical protein
MASKKVKITYQDETREPQIVKVLPRAQVMTEEHFSGFRSDNGIAATFYLGWAALNTLKLETLDFETWLNTIDDVEDYEDPKKPVEPTPGVQSSDTSLDSPS